jgi:hypothetical protein
LRSLHEHGADYLLIGRYALAAHGYQRATTDIDVVVPATSQAGQRVKEALMVLPDGLPKTSSQGGSRKIRVADAFVVDLMLNANGQTYDTLSQYAETKKTMREKDVADRIIIERALEMFKLHTRGDRA